MVIRPDDRVADVLRRDERLVEVFAAASPVFERLRNPGLRRVMARLVSVQQAARIAGVDAAALVDRLNAALAAAPSAAAAADLRPPSKASMPNPADSAVPTPLASVPPERLVDLDVRDDLRAGREPFSRIMTARQTVPPGGVLRLRAIFEPVPLYAVMQKFGFTHWTERLADDDWRVWFHRPGAEAGAAPAADAPLASAAADPVAPAGGEVVVLDVRGLEPPEPMLRTLAALEALPRGATLVQLNVRVPQFLLPRLEEAGFAYEIREQSDELVRLFIRHRGE